MHARVLPSTTLPGGHVVEHRLTLPARWRGALLRGDPTALPAAELVLITSIQSMFGFCVEASTKVQPAYHHDAVAEGIPVTDCLDYVFVDHEHGDIESREA